MQIIVNDNWLKACGLEYLSGEALEVTEVEDFDRRGKFYTVILPNKTHDFFGSWKVWDYRGVTVKG